MEGELIIDAERYRRSELDGFISTGIYIRARMPGGGFHSVDIWCLDRLSLMRWLRKSGGANELAENTVAFLLGHEVPSG